MKKIATSVLIFLTIIGTVISPFIAIQFLMIVGVFYVVVLLIALLFQPYTWAAQSSIIFVFGVATGLSLALALAFLAIATNSNFDKLITVASIVFPLLGGIATLYWFIKKHCSNPSFKRDWLKPAP